MTESTDTRTELDEFKARVREEALRAARDQGWCDSGLNETLRRLGLPEKRQPVQRTVTVTAQVPIRILVEPDADEAAMRAAAEGQIRNYVGGKARVLEVELPQPTPEGVPNVGDPCPDEGEWYATSVAEGGPNQCRVTDPDGAGYCTRALDHVVDFHVAAGRNAGVLAVWPAQAGDQRPDADRFANRGGLGHVDSPSDSDDDDYSDDDD